MRGLFGGLWRRLWLIIPTRRSGRTFCRLIRPTRWMSTRSLTTSRGRWPKWQFPSWDMDSMPARNSS
ncbi:UNVERIFIED_CONTAM: hypothetical protein Sradi_3878800 [Sesamum radiatum]|uniref:Secreted protein n=1 Tax=Sesamum radiatum TaxID=300843 RepID=A0AAW2Q2X1_SESRA